MRKLQFQNGGYYHVYNRGVDKRDIFSDVYDRERFFQSMEEFNTNDPIGSIYANSFHKQKITVTKKEELVSFICYCLNPNHFHFILQQVMERGVERFMHKLGSGYTSYFNKKYKRSGVLFQGQYKALDIDSDPYLLHVSAYVNLNNRVHNISNTLCKSSWEEYRENKDNFCQKDIILNQFKDRSAYRVFAENSLRDIKERKELFHQVEFEHLST